MPTISCSIMLNGGRYNTSESVMILYYNVIDPAAVLAPLSGAVQATDSENATAKCDEEILVWLHSKVNYHFSRRCQYQGFWTVCG